MMMMTTTTRPSLLLAVLLVCAATVALAQMAPIPHFKYNGSDHYEFGKQLGAHARAQIADRFTRSESLAKAVKFYNTDQGKVVYNQFVASNSDIFSLFWDELRGLSDGSGQPLYLHVLSTFTQEISYFLPKDKKSQNEDEYLHCSDYMLFTKTHAFVGHNEDAAKTDFNNMILVTAKFPDYPNWTAYVYAGDLPTGAWGFNDWGFAFTMNAVTPTQVRAGGWGRVFIARRLLEVFEWEEAFSIVGAPGQAVGHNYQLMYVGDTKGKNRHMQNLEHHGYSNTSSYLEIGEKAYFHPNIYLRLNVSQVVGNSSLHRLARVAQLPVPTSATEILNILGDQFDTAYPLFHDDASEKAGDVTNSRTVSTVMFDLMAKTATIYGGNPKLGKISTILHIRNDDAPRRSESPPDAAAPIFATA